MCARHSCMQYSVQFYIFRKSKQELLLKWDLKSSQKSKIKQEFIWWGSAYIYTPESRLIGVEL